MDVLDIFSDGLAFHKMHGLGNDFVVIDARARGVELWPDLVRAIGDRRRGVGFDQLALLCPPRHGESGAHLVFYNSDGSEAGACGNATRCIARWLMDESGAASVALSTMAGVLLAQALPNGDVAVNMGPPRLDWAQIPLARSADTLSLPLPGAPVATNMGNPHATFFVEDVSAIDLAVFGAGVEVDPLFPERTNVQIAQVVAPNRLRVRVWERGAGITPASGSSSCAAAVAAHRRGLTGRAVEVVLDGGELGIEWRDDGVWMSGASTYVFEGHLSARWLEALR